MNPHILCKLPGTALKDKYVAHKLSCTSCSRYEQGHMTNHDSHRDITEMHDMVNKLFPIKKYNVPKYFLLQHNLYCALLLLHKFVSKTFESHQSVGT